MNEQWHLQTVLDQQKKATNQLQIIRQHAWPEVEDDLLNNLFVQLAPHNDPELLRQVMGAGPNHSYVQVYVPVGSTLRAVGVPDDAVEVFAATTHT